MRFATDMALGKLGRHLRAAGFDTLCQHQHRPSGFFSTMERDRVILTRSTSVKRRLKDRRLIFIVPNEPWRQLEQVVRELDLRRSDTKPFSRCLQCNLEIQPIDKMAVRCLVPGYVWSSRRTFHTCRGCGRIYWAGSHRQRMDRRLAAMFPNRESENR